MRLCGEASGTPASCVRIAIRMDGEKFLALGGNEGYTKYESFAKPR